MTRAELIAALGGAPETEDRSYDCSLGQLVHMARARSPLVELELEPLEQLQQDQGLEELALSDVYAALRELERADRRGQPVRLEMFRIEDVQTRAKLPPLPAPRRHVGRRRRRVRMILLSRAQQAAFRASPRQAAARRPPAITTEVAGLRGRLGRAVQRLLGAALHSQTRGLDAKE
jgi:hypothetical protein